ncbi:hypothetical protein N7523_000156 [Penicillium sp. IBT 18751x]|nr:hypothetical protein N7523_000156 [Penicillium sp. IBT 18751x]
MLPSEYLGMTSHFALFKESTDQMDISETQNRQSHIDLTHDPSLSFMVDHGEIRKGAHLLRLLKDLPLYRRIVTSWLNATQDCDALGELVMEHVFHSLQELSDVHSLPDDALFSRSLEIFHLSSKPVPLHPSLTYSEFMSSMSFRWEIIGLAFTFVGAGAVLPGEWESLFQLEGKPVISRKDMGYLALSATETCLKFCNDAGVLNDVRRSASAYTSIFADYRGWRALGDLTTVIFTLGLNQPSSDSDIPFWLSEMRKRIMGSAYSADKQSATFLGRPPRLSWRFCNITLPLDIGFREVVAEPSVRDMAISRLDADGWSKTKSDSQAVWVRVALLMGPVRESILELSLNQQVEDLPAKIEQLLQQSDQVWSKLPFFIREGHDPSEVRDIPESIFLQVHLDYIFNRFLLYRILSKRLNIWSPDLVMVSHEVLRDILLLVESRIRAMKASGELSWVMSFFGLPVAGVLSIELIRRASNQSVDTPGPLLESAISFSRSQTIQDLSIFASYLQTIIKPHEGNYDICQQARGTIRRVLDFVLSPEAAQPVHPAMQSSAPNLQPPNSSDITDIFLDYNYYITHLDNWQFDLQNSLDML